MNEIRITLDDRLEERTRKLAHAAGMGISALIEEAINSDLCEVERRVIAKKTKAFSSHCNGSGGAEMPE
jgi:predicted transcriptional regulator